MTQAGGETNMPDNGERHSLVDAACGFWFHDNEQVRSPFPKDIQARLRQGATEDYNEWLDNLTDKDRTEVDNDELVSVFEMFLFREALELIDDKEEDLLLTVHHPFMPRVGDLVNDEGHGPSHVVERRIGGEDDNKPCFILVLETVESKKTWETNFVLPP